MRQEQEAGAGGRCRRQEQVAGGRWQAAGAGGGRSLPSHGHSNPPHGSVGMVQIVSIVRFQVKLRARSAPEVNERSEVART